MIDQKKNIPNISQNSKTKQFFFNILIWIFQFHGSKITIEILLASVCQSKSLPSTNICQWLIYIFGVELSLWDWENVHNTRSRGSFWGTVSHIMFRGWTLADSPKRLVKNGKFLCPTSTPLNQNPWGIWPGNLHL